MTEKCRKVLSVLGSTNGTVVMSRLMIYILWGDRPPAHPEMGLKSYVARVRSTTGIGIVSVRDQNRHVGYRLESLLDQHWRRKDED
jgi:hypothetical protein